MLLFLFIIAVSCQFCNNENNCNSQKIIQLKSLYHSLQQLQSKFNDLEDQEIKVIEIYTSKKSQLETNFRETVEQDNITQKINQLRIDFRSKIVEIKRKKIKGKRFNSDLVRFNVFKDTMERWLEFHQQQKKEIMNIKYYWYFVVKNSSWISELNPCALDYEVLEYLTDISISNIHSKIVPHTILPEEQTLLVGYTLSFEFKQNPYMNKTFLTKEIMYNINETNYPTCTIANCGTEMTDLYYDKLKNNKSFFDFFEIFDDDVMEEIALIDMKICKRIVKETLTFSYQYFERLNEESISEEDDYGEEDDYYDDYYDDE
ncbi:hypothetical protein EDI_252510 [Entamoeba dispar SAW760]|uniref:Nucleosome assembly protein n=1 Tax=Entamoeba dispar (strain ATCC PRA-260 / SAW760) TaxID=370354 RepID=B0EF56_ENTDS|nr:uncharacterized protein EDI_252510 [Entamoeba dispar SAW760]EDR26786.1 hypothetical protein EDI_252510 [Entamoeba dispar SAW760]|eukprot:EDR26786.1 hypothetical protein EDI_252510 [Entamoeba dispar SAW760]